MKNDKPFLDPNYKEPDTSNYMRLKQGENKFRVLSSAITGMEYWKETKEGRRPVRLKPNQAFSLLDLDEDKEGQKIMPKTFWAFCVWNYQSEKVQILELTQSTIRKKILALTKMEAWGDPKNYDISISREGEGFETEYTVMPGDKSKLDKGIIKLYEDMDIKLEALYKGDDPFKKESLADEADRAIK